MFDFLCAVATDLIQTTVDSIVPSEEESATQIQIIIVTPKA